MQLKLISNTALMTLYLFFSLPNINTKEKITALFFASFLYLLSYYCYKKFEKNYSVDLFIYLLITVGWVITFFTLGGTIGLIVGNFLFSLFPSLVLLFFFSLFDQKYYAKYKNLIVIQVSLGLLGFLTYISFTNAVYYAAMVVLCVLFNLFIILFIYYKELHEHKFQNIVRNIFITLAVATIPYLSLHLFPTAILNREFFSALYWLIYLFILFPIVIIYQFELKLQIKN
ncbi:MAG: hypothetical protein L0L86_07725, partial [Lactococcus lactis]|nr:hypothetical protein [Lactococcus lactis]